MTIGTATAAELSSGDKATVVALVKEAVDAWSRNDIEVAKRHMSPSVVLLDSLPSDFSDGTEGLPQEPAEAQRAIEGLDMQLPAESAKTALSLDEGREKAASQAHAAVLASEFAGTRREIEAHAASARLDVVASGRDLDFFEVVEVEIRR